MLCPASTTWGLLDSVLDSFSLLNSIPGVCVAWYLLFHFSRLEVYPACKVYFGLWLLYVYFISDTRFGTRLRAPYSFHNPCVYAQLECSQRTVYSFRPFSVYLMHSFLEEYIHTCLRSFPTEMGKEAIAPRSTVYLQATYVFMVLFVFVQRWLRAA